jgi:hypothetical protein
MCTYLNVGLLLMVGFTSDDADPKRDEITVELIPLKTVARSRRIPGINAKLKITNNSKDEMRIACRHDLRSNLTTILEGKDGKCVDKKDFFDVYFQFEEKTVAIASKESVTLDVGLTSLPVGVALELGGEYTVRGSYTIGKKEYKTNTVKFTVPKDLNPE